MTNTVQKLTTIKRLSPPVNDGYGVLNDLFYCFGHVAFSLAVRMILIHFFQTAKGVLQNVCKYFVQYKNPLLAHDGQM
jgi:hypothetical protein